MVEHWHQILQATYNQTSESLDHEDSPGFVLLLPLLCPNVGIIHKRKRRRNSPNNLGYQSVSHDFQLKCPKLLVPGKPLVTTSVCCNLKKEPWKSLSNLLVTNTIPLSAPKQAVTISRYISDLKRLVVCLKKVIVTTGLATSTTNTTTTHTTTTWDFVLDLV